MQDELKVLGLYVAARNCGTKFLMVGASRCEFLISAPQIPQPHGRHYHTTEDCAGEFPGGQNIRRNRSMWSKIIWRSRDGPHSRQRVNE
jgi:hypothetical protein